MGIKIVSVTESNIKPGIKNRLVIQNNESIDRVEYLDLN